MWTKRTLPWSGVLLLSGVMALSGVLDRSGVLPLSGFGNWPHPDLADRSVLFMRAWEERVRSGTMDLSLFGTLPDFGTLEVHAC